MARGVDVQEKTRIYCLSSHNVWEVDIQLNLGTSYLPCIPVTLKASWQSCHLKQQPPDNNISFTGMDMRRID